MRQLYTSIEIEKVQGFLTVWFLSLFQSATMAMTPTPSPAHSAPVTWGAAAAEASITSLVPVGVGLLVRSPSVTEAWLNTAEAPEVTALCRSATPEVTTLCRPATLEVTASLRSATPEVTALPRSPPQTDALSARASDQGTKSAREPHIIPFCECVDGSYED